MSRLRTLIRLESGQSLREPGKQVELRWRDEGTCWGPLDFEVVDDDTSIEKNETRQRQERRETVLTVRYCPVLAGRINAQWRVHFSPIPQAPEETWKVRGTDPSPAGRPRFLLIKLEREVR